MLEGIGIGGKGVADDRLHPPLSEGAARLLVAENFFQADHFLRQPGQPRLRRVDQPESFVERAEIGQGGAGRDFQPFIDAMAGAIQFFRHGAGEVGLPSAENFHQRLHPAGHFGVRARQRRHLRLGFGPASMAEQREESGQQNNNRKGPGAENGVRKGQKL